MNYILFIYRYFKGYLKICISEGFPERFLNLCHKNRIYIWDTTYNNSCIEAKIYCRDFFKLNTIRKKSGVKIKIEEKHGFHFSLRKVKKRQVMIYGLVISIVLMLLMNQFIWNIEVNGNKNISDKEILSIAEKLGLKYGTFVPYFDDERAGREAVNHFNGKALWASINIKGSKAIIEIREYEDISEAPENDEPCNLVADFDGIILSAEAYSGALSTICGNAVKKGDLLISGISENSDGTVNFHNASGKLTAYHKSGLESVYKNEFSVKKIYRFSECSFLNLFSIKMPLSLKKAGNLLNYSKWLEIDNKTLPFGFAKKVDFDTREILLPCNNVIYHIDNFTAEEYEKYKNTLILNKKYKITSDKNGLSVKSEYECIDFIGKKREILKEN